MIGVPLTAGFVSKWYLVQAALGDGRWVVAILILFSSLLAVIYVWRVVEIAYFRPLRRQSRRAAEAPAMMLVPTWILIGANVYFGIDTSLTSGLARRAAETFLGTGS